jgi:hypothetical protein
MPDPLSITTACVGLATGIAKVVFSIKAFVEDCQDASSDLDAIALELDALQAVLGLVQGHPCTSDDDQPQYITQQKLMMKIINSCKDVVSDVDKELKRLREAKLGASWHWAMGSGKAHMAEYRTRLGGYKTTLEMSLSLYDM